LEVLQEGTQGIECHGYGHLVPSTKDISGIGTDHLYNAETRADQQITADIYRWFGVPVYEYDMAKGIEDGYLAACEIHRFDLFHDHQAGNKRKRGLAQADLEGRRLVDPITQEILDATTAQPYYAAASIEDRLPIPDRVQAKPTPK
jgi:type I restriction enzyme R subunit